MPELPEVETVRRILEPIVQNKTIRAIRVIRQKNILSGAESFQASLIGETFLSVSRKGKYLLFHLTHDKVVISHLRMEGKYFEKPSSEPLNKFDLLVYDFTDGSSLRYNDVRKFGTIELSDEQHAFLTKSLQKLGPEPFALNSETLLAGLQKRKATTIKEALLDQTLIAGLGNIYVDETLFAAKIHPLRKAGSISLSEADSLLKEARRILSEAIDVGGSTIRSYHPKEGVNGEMQNELLAYGKDNTPCPHCGFPLRRITIGGRGTVYCPHCQKNPGHPLIIGVTGPIASGKSAVSHYLEKKGYEILDADAIVADLYQKPAIQKHLIALFGKPVIVDNAVNRPYLLSSLQANPKLKLRLEKYLHPRVFQEMEKRIEKTSAEKLVLDVPLLIGSPLEEKCDLIIAIFASEATQIARLVDRGKDPEKSLALNAHWPRGIAKQKAAIVLDGNHGLDYLTKELDSYPFL